MCYFWAVPASWPSSIEVLVSFLASSTSGWSKGSIPLRIILLVRESSTMPPLHHRVRGYCPDSTPLLLSVPGLGTPVAVYHIVLRLAQPRCCDAAETRHARKAT